MAMEAQANQQPYSDEYEHVMLLKNTFDQNLFPSEFDKWTVNEQCDWVNENLRKFYPNVPESLLELIPASFHQGNYDRSGTSVPEWFDIDKYRKGQKFVKDNYIAVVSCMLLAVLHMYSFEDIVRGFIMGGNVHIPYPAFHRYLSTIWRITNWFNGEPWVEGTTAFKDMRATRRLHLLVRRKICRLDNDKIDAACTFANPWCPSRDIMLKDFSVMCLSEKDGQRPYKLFAESPYRPKSLSTAHLAATQCCFMGLVLLYPQQFGAHNVTDDELEAFCHIWRCYGYFLGIEDEYNFCRGSFEQVKQRTRDFYQYWLMPNFKDISPEWEHMTRCIVEPFNYLPLTYIPYKTAVLFSTEVFDIKMPNLRASLNYSERIAYKMWR
ncbi:hypothetical protein X777_02752 [Ooceraea biroi]|uniref:Uncharacterized protein n=1 Tax=Ooceraea biroi TaxID=2015173 RepID=A0A026WML0_OOCBI|nr:hypothetical protein X777_02752 [Ooceraea biroi]